MCFAKHTLNKYNLGPLGLKPRSGPLYFFGLGLAQPTWADLDPAGLVRLLVQTSNRPRKQTRVNQLTRALHCAKLINYLRTILKSSHLTQSKRRKPYLTKTKMKVMVLAQAEECSPLPPPFSPSSLYSSVLRLCYGFSPPFLGFVLYHAYDTKAIENLFSFEFV